MIRNLTCASSTRTWPVLYSLLLKKYLLRATWRNYTDPGCKLDGCVFDAHSEELIIYVIWYQDTARRDKNWAENRK